MSKPKHAHHNAKEWWIVTDHRYFKHPSEGLAQAERKRLAELHPDKEFFVHRVKRNPRRSVSKHIIFELVNAAEAILKEIRAYQSPECDDPGAPGAAELKALDNACQRARGVKLEDRQPIEYPATEPVLVEKLECDKPSPNFDEAGYRVDPIESDREPVGAITPEGERLDRWDERLRAAGCIPIYGKE